MNNITKYSISHRELEVTPIAKPVTTDELLDSPVPVQQVTVRSEPIETNIDPTIALIHQQEAARFAALPEGHPEKFLLARRKYEAENPLVAKMSTMVGNRSIRLGENAMWHSSYRPPEQIPGQFVNGTGGLFRSREWMIDHGYMDD